MKNQFPLVAFITIILALYLGFSIHFFETTKLQLLEERYFNMLQFQKYSEDIVVLNIGKLKEDEIAARIDTILLQTNLKVVGVNTCDFNATERFFNRFKDNSRVVMGVCEPGLRAELGRDLLEDNIVTHFRTDRPDYFEVQLTNSWEELKRRGNASERIDFVDRTLSFIRLDLDETKFADNDLSKTTMLVGYMGDNVTNEILDYRSCRITPMNDDYGFADLAPDMYDIEISANIIQTIESKAYYTEISLLGRVAIIFGFCFLNVLMIQFVRLKWELVNVTLYVVGYFMLLTVAGILMVFCFERHVYLQLNELQILLLITSIFTIAIRQRKPIIQSISQKLQEAVKD